MTIPIGKIIRHTTSKNFRARVKAPVDLIIISIEKIKKSPRSVSITPDWNFEPKFSFISDFDGDEILNNIKNKIRNSASLTDEDAYLFAVLPFTKHGKDTAKLVEELCYWVNEIDISPEHKYIIKLCQILWVQALIKDEEQSERLMDVIKMRNTFLIEYEKNLVETAVETNNKNIAQEMFDMGYPRKDILKLTGIDIQKM